LAHRNLTNNLHVPGCHPWAALHKPTGPSNTYTAVRCFTLARVRAGAFYGARTLSDSGWNLCNTEQLFIEVWLCFPSRSPATHYMHAHRCTRTCTHRHAHARWHARTGTYGYTTHTDAHKQVCTHMSASTHRYIWIHNTHCTRTCLKSYVEALPSPCRVGQRVVVIGDHLCLSPTGDRAGGARASVRWEQLGQRALVPKDCHWHPHL